MANRDIDIPRGTDYILKFEFLGANNQAYVFDSDDLMRLEMTDIEGAQDAYPITINLENYTNPVSVIIPRVLTDTFESNPIKYKLLLIKDPDLHLCLLSGYINLV